jgi:hypothetical protein
MTNTTRDPKMPNEIRNELNSQLRDINAEIQVVEQKLAVAIEWVRNELNYAINQLAISRGRGKTQFGATGLIERKGIVIDTLTIKLRSLQDDRDMLMRVKNKVANAAHPTDQLKSA